VKVHEPIFSKIDFATLELFPCATVRKLEDAMGKLVLGAAIVCIGLLLAASAYIISL
jgi:hypothetical protein